MATERRPSEGRLRRLTEELNDEGLLGADRQWPESLLIELDYALRPPIHEKRIPAFGAIHEPRVDPVAWREQTALTVSRRWRDEVPGDDARRYADGLSSWMVRQADGSIEIIVFDRPTGSERDLVVLAEATNGTLVQRHPMGSVRMVGDFGVLRWDGVGWHHEPPLKPWMRDVAGAGFHGDAKVLAKLMAFAVYDLGATGVGALLAYRPASACGPTSEVLLPPPPPFEISRPEDLGPLRHVLALVDGAAVFDDSGTLQELGVRLVPSAEAESDISAYRGMRHTSALRYSADDPTATLIVVSEDGPVSVIRNGQVLARPVEHPGA
ncbi:MAG TPA: DNA integrity scanning protein DisA nucleotide-binding domain protein [Acidimicrobiales bacterium]|nr:DNA integrity scanning protein DisA nucleotide-binding domain protein [Acidimicrobiales bacterium]